MHDRSFTALLLATFTAAILGSSDGSAQALASRDTFPNGKAPKMIEAALLPGSVSKTQPGAPGEASITDMRASRFEPGAATTIVALVATAFWLTVVAHVFGSPSPPRRRRS